MSLSNTLPSNIRHSAQGITSGEPIRNFLAPDEYLVYIERREAFGDVDGYTHIAHKVRDYIEDDKLWYDFLLETDTLGNRLQVPDPITISGDMVISDRSFHDIVPKQMYYFAPTTTVSNTDGDSINQIVARSFVIKSNINKPLESTSRNALGSGIYGIYIENPSNVSSLMSNPEQSVYVIDNTNAYPIQDKEHGESLTVASLSTNRYMDHIIQELRGTIFNKSSDHSIDKSLALSMIQANESPILFTLWNIVLYRTGDMVTQKWLNEILANYAVKYFGDNNLVDSINGDILQELPINDIMYSLNYDGIIASDPYNNNWNRGCVNYDYSQASIIRGETAIY